MTPRVLFFEGFQPQKFFVMFSFLTKNSYLLTTKIASDINNDLQFLHGVKELGDSFHVSCNFWCLIHVGGIM